MKKSLYRLFFFQLQYIEAWLSLVERCVRDVARFSSFSTEQFFHRGVAQLGGARRSGRRGRRFESCHSDFFMPNSTFFLPICFYSEVNPQKHGKLSINYILLSSYCSMLWSVYSLSVMTLVILSEISLFASLSFTFA